MDKEIIITLRQGEDFIRLSQALKKAAITDSGAEAKMRIRNGEFTVNAEEENRPGRKLYDGDAFTGDGRTFRIRKQ